MARVPDHSSNAEPMACELPRQPQANPEAVPRIRIGWGLNPQSDGASGISRDVVKVAAATDRTGNRALDRIFVMDLFVAPLGIEVVDDKFPDATAHVSKAKSISSPVTVVIDGGNHCVTVAPGKFRAGPDIVFAR